ncbi:hypothetical protein [Streptomyces sp. OE57]|uniref:hypothetical protein n=1 Tax=Streptomyces lacaronensis TaxID=3379885 RepID=UPI0039B783C9
MPATVKRLVEPVWTSDRPPPSGSPASLSAVPVASRVSAGAVYDPVSPRPTQSPRSLVSV